MKKKTRRLSTKGRPRAALVPSGADGDLARRHAGLVGAVANRYHAQFPRISLEELIAEGNRGLVEAAARYDPCRKVKFSTYAWFWIVKNIKDYVTAGVAVIDMPRSVAGDLRRVTGALAAAARAGRQLSIAAVARQLDMSADDVRDLLRDGSALGRVLSIDKYLDDDDRTQTVADMVADPAETDRAAADESGQVSADIRDVLCRLAPQERAVIELRFGMGGAAPLTMRATAAQLKLTPGKVRDIESVARLKLKNFLRERHENA